MEDDSEAEGEERTTSPTLRQCRHQLEHEGGAFWCTLPIGHAGAHEPAPHEREETFKRQRAPPKRLGEEPALPEKRRRSVKDGGEEVQQGRKVAKSARFSPGMEPNGHLTSEQEAQRISFAGNRLAELQAKLPDAMRSAGWVVVPKGERAIETGHFWVRAFA